MLKEVEKAGLRFYVSSVIQGAATAGKGGVIHGFLTREGGVSKPPFDSLNFDPRGPDPPENIEKNKGLLKRAFVFRQEEMKRFFLMDQVHGDRVITVRNPCPPCPDDAKKGADGAITNASGVPVGILTADCQPILFYDPVKKAIGAAHAGWKGTLLGIAIKTVEAMRLNFGSRPEDMIAALGPCIRPCCYEVKKDVFDGFKARFQGEAQGFFIEDKGLRLDMEKANAFQLASVGLKHENISTSGLCTSCEAGSFFSYRKEGGKTGRQLSFIMLRA